MSLGSQFLKRLDEAKKATKEKSTQGGATFDRGTEAAKRMIAMSGGQEKNYGDKIAELLNMVGVGGFYIKKQEVIASIAEKGKELTTNGAGPAFLRLYNAVREARGMTMEARNTDLIGTQFQQMFEEVLVSLGAPVDLVGAKAKATVKTTMRSLMADMATNPMVVKALRAYATKVGIKASDSVTGASKKVQEEVGTKPTSGTVAPGATMKAVNDSNLAGHAIALVQALGLPLNTMFIRNMNKAAEQTKLNNTIKSDPALTRAVRAYVSASR